MHVVIDRSVRSRLTVRGTVEWVHDVIRGQCPSAVAFYFRGQFGHMAIDIVIDSSQYNEESLHAIGERIQSTLADGAPAGCSYVLSSMMFDDPTKVGMFQCNCSAPVGGPHDWNCPSPKYTSIDAAVSEIARLRADNERVRAENVTLRKFANDETMRLADHRAALVKAVDFASDCRQGEKRALSALDKQARFLAGLDDRRWSKPEQEQRRALVGKAHELLRGSDDTRSAEDLAFEERFGRPHIATSKPLVFGDGDPPAVIAANLRKAWRFSAGKIVGATITGPGHQAQPLKIPGDAIIRLGDNIYIDGDAVRVVRNALEAPSARVDTELVNILDPDRTPAEWPVIQFDRVNLAGPVDPLERPGVRASTMVTRDRSVHPFAMQTDFDPADPGSYDRACERLRATLRMSVEYLTTSLRKTFDIGPPNEDET